MSLEFHPRSGRLGSQPLVQQRRLEHVLQVTGEPAGNQHARLAPGAPAPGPSRPQHCLALGEELQNEK